MASTTWSPGQTQLDLDLSAPIISMLFANSLTVFLKVVGANWINVQFLFPHTKFFTEGKVWLHGASVLGFLESAVVVQSIAMSRLITLGLHYLRWQSWCTGELCKVSPCWLLTSFIPWPPFVPCSTVKGPFIVVSLHILNVIIPETKTSKQATYLSHQQIAISQTCFIC